MTIWSHPKTILHINVINVIRSRLVEERGLIVGGGLETEKVHESGGDVGQAGRGKVFAEAEG